MKFQKGNKLGGRKKLTDEIKQVIEYNKEKITQEALIELANNKVYQALQEVKSVEEIKGLGLPITLKGMTEKKDITSGGEKIIGINYINPDGTNNQTNEETTPSISST